MNGQAQILFGTIAIREKRTQYRTSLSSEYNMGKCEFIAKEQGRGWADGKSLRGNIKTCKRDSG